MGGRVSQRSRPKIICLCAGGHARAVLGALTSPATGGFLDDNPRASRAVLGPLAALPKYRGWRFFVGLGAHNASGCADRRRLYVDALVAGLKPLTVLAPSAIVRGQICPGGQILALAHVGPGAVIGENAVVNTLATVEHDALVGAHAFVGPGAILLGRCRVAEEAFIGAGAVILPGLKVGYQATLGAGAVLTRDMPDGETWIGMPARRA